jgi:hypothetical protein
VFGDAGIDAPIIGLIPNRHEKVVPAIAACEIQVPINGMGLTFGTISSLFGLTAGFINQTQYSLLYPLLLRKSGLCLLKKKTLWI